MSNIQHIRTDEIEDHYLVVFSTGVGYYHIVEQIGKLSTMCGKKISYMEGYVKGRKIWLESLIYGPSCCLSCQKIYKRLESRGDFHY